MVLPLSQIDMGKKVKVVWVASQPDMATRLSDLGFVPDEEISCVLSGPSGGMRAYLVRNAVIALRQQNSSEIFVESVPECCP
ncbi:MAG: ferrous iron transport protein A [Hungatella sp.]|jgi:ferrous iron transport protein A|nr:ferrous iron transport protein A [Hungatella sp.]